VTYKGYVEFEVESQPQAHALVGALLEVLPHAEKEFGVNVLDSDAFVSKVEETDEPVEQPNQTFNIHVDGPKNVEELVTHLIKIYDSLRRPTA